jgi:hypothetical protein
METEINVSERDSETDLIQAISRFHEALNTLMVQPEIQGIINKSSQGVGRKFNIDEAELAEFLSKRLPYYLATINTANPDWEELLSRWCRSVVNKHGLNILNHHSETKKKHEDLVMHLNTKGKRNSRRMLKSDVPTPEDELSIKEEEPIWEARAEDIRAKTRPLISEDEAVELWSKGCKPKHIAEILKKSPKTIYDRLSKKHKAVIQEIGFIEPEKDKKNKALIKEGLRELYANSLEQPDLNAPDREDTDLLNVTVSAQDLSSEPNGGISKRSDISVVIHKRPRKKSPPDQSH